MRWKQTFGVGLGALAGSYVAVSALMARGLTHGARRPLLDNPGAVGLDYTDITFKSVGDRLTLTGWLLRPGPTAADTEIPWIVIVHGHGAHRADPETGVLALARDFSRIGYGVFLFDLRGCGTSPARPASAGFNEQRDLLGALHYLEALGVPSRNIGVIGFSLGGAVAIMACARHGGAAAVIADSSFADLELRVRQSMTGRLAPLKIFEPGMRLMSRVLYGIDIRAVSPMRAIATSDLPVLLIHGDRDEIVPMIHFRLLSRAVESGSGETWLAEETEHAQAYRTHPEEYLEKVQKFLSRYLEAAPQSGAANHPNGRSGGGEGLPRRVGE